MNLGKAMAVALISAVASSAGAQSLIFKDGYEPQAVCTAPAGFTGLMTEFRNNFGNWPAYNEYAQLWVRPNEYLAFRFTASTLVGEYGTFDGSGGFPGDGDGQAIMSISEVPGCFDPARLKPGCYAGPAPFPGISWITGADGFPCRLTPGASYYLNITFGPLPAGGECQTGMCGRHFANIQQTVPE